MQYLFVEPDTSRTVDTFYDEVDLIESIIMGSDIFVLKTFQIKLL